jgi:hypothetical protein
MIHIFQYYKLNLVQQKHVTCALTQPTLYKTVHPSYIPAQIKYATVSRLPLPKQVCIPPSP